MTPWQLRFGIFSLVAVIMFVMAAASFGYLLGVRKRTRATQQLLWFFACVMLSALATLLTNLGLRWSWAFAPSQDAFLILAGVFLTRFAFAYPEPEQSAESRWAVHLAAGVAALALGYSFYFGVQYLANLPVETDESRAYYLLTPVTILGIVLVLFRRSLHLSWQAGEAQAGPRQGVIAAMLRPCTLPAIGLRNLGLALSIGLVPAAAFLAKPALPALVASFLFNFGVVAAISAIMLVYLNYAPEPTTVTAKLVGVSLVTILLLLGLACTVILTFVPGLDASRVVSIFMLLVPASSAVLFLGFPFFFRTTLLEPLSLLLDGVGAAEKGQMEQSIEVRFDDELGRLTRAFNRMVLSIRNLTQEQQRRAEDLERAVAERTDDLRQTNQRLLDESERREEARNRLDLQLGYEHALAECSRVLLESAGDGKDRQGALGEALEGLRAGTGASRAYLLEIFDDDQRERRLRLLAESCAQGVPSNIANPENQRFPLAGLPQALVRSLESGTSVAGSVETIFHGHPLADAFRRQNPPLLSVLLFPIHRDQQWWGAVGFDACEAPRVWGPSEVALLGTAAEMIGSTLHRWEIRDRLARTLAELEQRVEERTESLNEANRRLQEEIAVRRGFQADLETRLHAERMLARASARLVGTQDAASVYPEVLRELGQMVEATLVALVVRGSEGSQPSRETYLWHPPSRNAPAEALLTGLIDPAGPIYPLVAAGRPLILKDIRHAPAAMDALGAALVAEGSESLTLWPLVSDSALMGALLIGRAAPGAEASPQDLQTLEVFLGLLGGLLERDRILRSLELRVAEQTRELSALYEMTMLTQDSRDLSESLTRALRRIQETTGSESACIHLYVPAEESLELMAHAGLSRDVLLGLQRISIGDRFKEWLDRPEPDTTMNRTLPAGIPDPFCFPGVRFMLMAKLRAAGTTQGTICCYRASKAPFTPFQTSILAVIGEVLGVVVENHRLTGETGKLATIHERQRLARDLHDAVSQSVYSLSLFARAASDAREDGDDAKLTNSLQELEENSISALREMRLLLYQLRSLALEEGGFVQAVETRMNMVERRLGMEAVLDVDEDLAVDSALEQDIFRVVTEALNNSLHYAKARRVSVSLHREQGALRLAVEDDGGGFDPARAREGIGLRSIRERVLAHQGTFEIESQPGRGTRLRICIPQSPSV